MPALIAAYILLVRRKKKTALRYANLSLVKEAMGAGQRFRRHIPPLLFLAALTVLIVAVARPSAVVTLPTQHETVILAMDTSGSMRATDVEPSRIAAAQAAAKSFVADQPRHTRIGVVTFAGTAAVAQAPTENREEILAAIDRFQLQRATAIGSGILVSLKTIFPDAEFDLRSWISGRTQCAILARRPARPGGRPEKTGVQAGSTRLLHIGRHHPADRRPVERRDPTPSKRPAWPPSAGCASTPWGSAPAEGGVLRFEGWSMRVRLDEEALKTIAELTRGSIIMRAPQRT